MAGLLDRECGVATVEDEGTQWALFPGAGRRGTAMDGLPMENFRAT